MVDGIRRLAGTGRYVSLFQQGAISVFGGFGKEYPNATVLAECWYFIRSRLPIGNADRIGGPRHGLSADRRNLPCVAGRHEH